MAIDPVCGMSVDEKEAQFKIEYKGTTYYFCSKHCLEEFKRNPEKYIRGAGKTKSHEHHHHHHADFLRRLFLSLLLTIPIVLLSPLASSAGIQVELPYRDFAVLVSSTLLFLVGGTPFLAGAAAELGEKKPGMMTLVSTGIVVSYFYSSYALLTARGETFFTELAMLIDVMLLGHYIEGRVFSSAMSSLSSLARLIPDSAHLVTENGVRDVPSRELSKGDVVLVKPGERVPADGVVVRGESSVDESLLTGESVPVPKRPGSRVIGGSLNLDGALEVRVEESGENTYLMRVSRIIEELRMSKSSIEKLADRVAYWLTILVVGVSVLTLLAWLLAGADPGYAVERMAAVAVVACPHALGLAVPLVVYRAGLLSSSRGIVVKKREVLDAAPRVSVVVFDKTGTLTEGVFQVERVEPLNGYTSEEVLRLAASLEALASHPIARAIIEEAQRKGLRLASVEEFTSVPGVGVKGRIEGKTVVVSSPRYAGEVAVQGSRGGTVVAVTVDGVTAGAIVLKDRVRPSAERAVRRLREMGYRVYMLTGDKEDVAREVAQKLGLDGYYSELLPEDKVKVVEDIQEKGFSVMMVGDGVNDAPALVKADVGVAMGAGTDIAIESADVVLVRDDPELVPEFLGLMRRAHRKMKENIAWAVAYNSVTVPLAAGVLASLGVAISPALGAVIMSLSDIIVVVNAQLLK